MKHENINLDSIVEIDKNQQKNILSKWGNGFHIYTNIDEAFQYNKSDIVIVASPTSTHLKVIQSILKIYEPKLIICEKPIVSDAQEYKTLNSLMDTKTSKLLTNFPRRFDPSINSLKDFIQNSTKKIEHFYGTFTKGLLHNGSHMLDLISMLIGNITHVESIENKNIANDSFGKYVLKTSTASGIISNINNNSLSLFELIIYTDSAKIEISGSNQDIKIHHLEKSDKFKEYQSFSQEEILPNTLDLYALNTLEYAIEILKNDTLYQEIKQKQQHVNDILFKTQQKMMEN